MPNHIHGIISIVGAPLVGARTTEIDSPKRADTRPAPTMGLGDMVGTHATVTFRGPGFPFMGFQLILFFLHTNQVGDQYSSQMIFIGSALNDSLVVFNIL